MSTVKLPPGMTRNEALLTIRQRRRDVTQRLVARRRQLRELAAEVESLEGQLRDIEQAEHLLAD